MLYSWHCRQGSLFAKSKLSFVRDSDRRLSSYIVCSSVSSELDLQAVVQMSKKGYVCARLRMLTPVRSVGAQTHAALTLHDAHKTPFLGVINQ